MKVLSFFSSAILFLWIAADPVKSTIHNGNEPRSTSSTSLNSTENPTLGWVAQPNQRGSIDIIWSCLVTIFICAWYSLCLNVPAATESRRHIFREKVLMASLTVLGPEFLFLVALGQWQSARKSVQDFHSSGFENWTMSHAFFADMGGFVLRTRDWTPFPLNAKQLHYLVTKKYLDIPVLGKEEIKDRNKVDGLARIITIFQVFWFTVNSIGRAIQHLEISTGELTVLGFIVCTFATNFCWIHKPSDVGYAIVLESKASINEIVLEAGDSTYKPYKYTPLDFVSREEWSWSRYWTCWINILDKMHITVFARSVAVRPINRIANDNFLKVSSKGLTAFFLLSLAYGSIFVCGWNFSFPTGTERLLWRIVTLVNMGIICVAYFVVDPSVLGFVEDLRRRGARRRSPKQQASQTATQWQNRKWIRSQASRLAVNMRNNSPDCDPEFEVTLSALIPVSVAGAIYCFARAFVLIEDCLVLRALPPSAYQTVNWSQFIPHI